VAHAMVDDHHSLTATAYLRHAAGTQFDVRTPDWRISSAQQPVKHKINNNDDNNEPIATEILGVFNASARHLLDDLGRRISENSGEARETRFLYKR